MTNLPLARLGVFVNVDDTEANEARNDLGKAIALQSPTDALRDLNARVEHGGDEHEAGGDRAFGCAEEEAQEPCLRAKVYRRKVAGGGGSKGAAESGRSSVSSEVPNVITTRDRPSPVDTVHKEVESRRRVHRRR